MMAITVYINYNWKLGDQLCKTPLTKHCSSIKGSFPSKGVSIKGPLPLKAIFHQNSTSTKSVFHQRSSTIKGRLLS